MQAREAQVRKLIEVGTQAVADEVCGEGHDYNGDEVVSAYVTMCRNALLAARTAGSPVELLVQALQRVILEVSDTKGRVM